MFLFNQLQRLESSHVPIQPTTKVRIRLCYFSTISIPSQIYIHDYTQPIRLESVYISIQQITKVGIRSYSNSTNHKGWN